MTEFRERRGIVTDIQRCSIQDGPGIRTTVFLKGCPLRCGWCSNPETQKIEPEEMLDARTGKAVTVGREMAVCEVLDVVRRDKPFYDGSNGGLTLSGGEALLQPAFSEGLLWAAKEEGIHTTLMTCGYAKFDAVWPVFEQCDLILFDIKGMDEEKHRAHTGVSPLPIHENLEKLLAKGKAVIVRVPVIPDHNDNKDALQAIVNYASSAGVSSIEFLPYHRLGESKYQRLHRKYPWKGISQVNAADLSKIVNRLDAPKGIKLIVN